MSNIGIYSGTFDPVHVGHVNFSLTAAEELHLEKVIFLVEKSPREKTVATSYIKRHHMIELAIQEQQLLTSIEVPYERFTVAETLPYLQKMHTGSRLVFLLGSDVVRTFSYRWNGLKEFLQSVSLCIGLRGDDTKEQVCFMIEETAKHYAIDVDFTIIEKTNRHLASTKIRQGNHYITDLNPTVAAYIKQSNLYS